MDSTADYMNGFHFGFSYARTYGNATLLQVAARGGLRGKTSAYNAGVVDAAIALAQVTR